MTAEITSDDRLGTILSNIEDLTSQNLNGETMKPIGSDLDDEVAMVASIGLSTALDCLALFVDLTRTERFIIRPFAHFPVIRTAMLGASQAVWVLGCSEREQLARATAVKIESLGYEISYRKDFEGADYLKPRLGADMFAALRSEIEDLTTEQSDLIRWAKENGLNATANATVMQLRAAQLCWDAGHPVSQQMHMGVMAQWRIASSVAHARAWSLQHRGKGFELRDDRPAAEFRSSAEELTNALFLTEQMCREGLRLWKVRNAF